MSTQRSYIAENTPDWVESTSVISNPIDLTLVGYVSPLPAETVAAAARYVRRRCGDADLMLDMLGLDVTS